MTTIDADEAPDRNRRAWPIATNRVGGLLASLLGIVLSMLLAGTDAWAKGAIPMREPSAPPAESIGHFASRGASETDGAPSSAAPTALKDTYAAREANAKSLEKFRGGDVVIISSTTVLVVLLVVLIIVVAA